jgi:hypothetical protein
MEELKDYLIIALAIIGMILITVLFVTFPWIVISVLGVIFFISIIHSKFRKKWW